ncbi:MAG: septation protein IspZ [Hyphomonadaceae bacterium]
MREDTDTATPPAQTPKQTDGAGAQVSDGAAGLWGELWPVLSFLVVYNVMRRFPEGDGWFTPDTALYWATGILMIGMSFEVGKRLLRKEKISPLLLMSTGMVVVFGILGIVFGKGFLLHKPTVINLTFASIIFGGLMTGRNLWRIMFDGLFSLPDFAWDRLATCWGIYFIAMAGWNEILVATVSEDAWANWKLGNLVIGLVFAMSLVPYTLKHTISDEAEDAA